MKNQIKSVYIAYLSFTTTKNDMYCEAFSSFFKCSTTFINANSHSQIDSDFFGVLTRLLKQCSAHTRKTKLRFKNFIFYLFLFLLRFEVIYNSYIETCFHLKLISSNVKLLILIFSSSTHHINTCKGR